MLPVGCLLALYAGLAWMLFGLEGLVWLLVLGALVAVLRPAGPARRW